MESFQIKQIMWYVWYHILPSNHIMTFKFAPYISLVLVIVCPKCQLEFSCLRSMNISCGLAVCGMGGGCLHGHASVIHTVAWDYYTHWQYITSIYLLLKQYLSDNEVLSFFLNNSKIIHIWLWLNVNTHRYFRNHSRIHHHVFCHSPYISNITMP